MLISNINPHSACLGPGHDGSILSSVFFYMAPLESPEPFQASWDTCRFQLRLLLGFFPSWSHLKYQRQTSRAS